ncbi:hypothetical protein B0H10DRAFT_2049012 [Mycena sp. CBHHK59/15]|nr:hypothetical protein B0H10DRAFT_2049012 [Mycena sp. CBHHK59/15]
MAGIVVGELDSDSEMEDEDEDGDESFDEEEEDSDDASSSGDTEFGGWQARRSGGGPADGDESDGDGAAGARRGVSELGSIGLENLTTMIRRDELQPGRGRRRIFYHTGLYGHPPNNSRLPADSLLVGKWIKSEFGAQSSVTATFFTHAIINSNNSLMHNYLLAHDAVPITFKHFRILARLGRARVDFYLYERIKIGAPFYATEDDYVSNADAAKHLFRKLSKGGDAPPCVKAEPADTAAGLSSPRGRKRPRRSTAATVASYAVPDSDDEAIAEEEDAEFAEFRTGGGGAERRRKMVKVETHLERWIKALGELFKEEQRKYREKKKRVLEKAAEPGVKIRVPKNEFFKSLGMNLRLLRQLDTERRMFRPAAVDEAFSDDEDDEYVQQKASRAKRRKTT